ncbi:MAG: hypothetical protein GX221_00320 [Candidatus Riflebacteria bacterium]|nr:hypothetical protein [Candidatus Riflebacteria bacterium]
MKREIQNFLLLALFIAGTLYLSSLIGLLPKLDYEVKPRFLSKKNSELSLEKAAGRVDRIIDEQVIVVFKDPLDGRFNKEITVPLEMFKQRIPEENDSITLNIAYK